jgi:DinB superfamily
MTRLEDLHRRMQPAHASWQAAVSDLTLEQVNHQERPRVLPIAFSLMHLVNTEDARLCAEVAGQESLWVREGWAERVRPSVQSVFRGTPLEVAETLRFGDLDAWRAYQSAVFAQTDMLLASMDDARWDDVWLEQVPDSMRGGFLHLLSGDGSIVFGDFLEVVLYHHSLRHLGELEHARSLVGLTGVGG